MPNYRRAIVPGGTYFFTLVTYQRRPYFADDSARKLLGRCLRDCQKRWPFELNAIVLLPEHLHAIWTLPSGDSEYSRRLAWIKKEFTKSWLVKFNTKTKPNKALQKERRQGIWQPRFWEHTIENEEDFEAHFDYIHYNPVKHGYVKCPHEWQYSSFHRWVKAGVYEQAWACWGYEEKKFSFQKIKHDFGE